MDLIYSIFILLVVFQIVNSEERTSSLTFVIDNTGSMEDDIAQVKLRTKEICDAVVESNVSVIENFVLATFNDPGVELRTITTKHDEFKIALDAVSVNGGEDCPEMSLLGIELGIDSSNPESFVYVFTDASAKDYDKYDIVSKKALMKGTEVTFLLTKDCGCPNCPNYKVYDRLATATGGQVFHMDKPNLSEVLNYIVDSAKSKNCLISHDILPKINGRVITHPFSVDCKMRDVTLTLLGNSPEFKVYHMDGSEVTMTQLVKTKNIYIAKFNNIVPGDYIAKVSVTDGDADLMIKGACSFSFRHGFSPFQPSSINETIFTPSLGEKGFLSVELISEDTANDVKLLGVQIRDIDGNAVMNLTLNIANAKENLYVSDGFVAPDKAFKIAIVGAAENCGKKEIIRVTKSSIEPMNHSPAIFNQVPTIQKLEIITADKETVSIQCKASGYPKPKIIWKDRNGDTISNATAVNDDVTGKQITSILTMLEPEDNLFTCEATNDAGTDSDFIPLKLPRKPVIDKTIKEIVKIKGNEVEIFCSLKQGNPKPEISWYFMEENDNEYVKLKYTSESLLIYNLGIGNSGSYKCEAVNSEGSDTYEMDLFISDPWEKKVKAYEGELVTLNCPGRPNRAQPSVRWFVDDREVVNGGRYHIHRNHSLSFKASTYDYGRYDCVSINRKKRERRKMFRLKINPVLQFRNLN